MTDCESKEANKTSKTYDQEWHPVKDTLRSTPPDDSLSRKYIHKNFFTLCNSCFIVSCLRTLASINNLHMHVNKHTQKINHSKAFLISCAIY